MDLVRHDQLWISVRARITGKPEIGRLTKKLNQFRITCRNLHFI